MAIANVALTNTFDEQRARINQVIDVANALTEGFFKKTSGTIVIDNPTFANGNVSLLVANGFISGNGAGITGLQNTAIAGKFTNAQLQNTTITITSNTTGFTVSGGTITLGGASAYVNAAMSSSVDEESNNIFATSNAVNTVHRQLQAANVEIRILAATGNLAFTVANAAYGAANNAANAAGVAANTGNLALTIANTANSIAANAGFSLTYVTANVALADKGTYLIAASSNICLSLPSTPAVGASVRLIDGNTINSTIRHTLYGNSKNIMGSSANVFIDIPKASFLVWYNGTEWKVQ